VAAAHLQGLQAAVAAPVVHSNADGGSELAGDASLLQKTTARNSETGDGQQAISYQLTLPKQASQ
jgi:hypothetical protein